MSKKLRDKVEYLVLLIAEFAVRCKVTEVRHHAHTFC